METVAEVRAAVEQRRQTSVEIGNYKKNDAAFWNARGAEFELIQKPYRRTDLATKVRQVIVGPTGVG